jgi:hypothetical protein
MSQVSVEWVEWSLPTFTSSHTGNLSDILTICVISVLNSQYQVSEYNRRRGHIGGGINQFNHPYMFN